MPSKVSVSIVEDHTEEVKEKMKDAIETALNAVGTQAVGHAVAEITSQGAIDTGLLRNSITYALDGGGAKNTSYHASKGSNKNAKGKRVSASSTNAGSVKVGHYSGTAPADSDGSRTVYIGTNVYYAPYVEMGHRTKKGKRVPARPFIKPAVENFTTEYKQIFEEALKKAV